MEQRVEYCLDLRELIKLGGLPQAQDVVVDALLDNEAFSSCRRVYLGSSFCPQSLLSSRGLFNSTIEICRRRGFSVTLSIPIVAQRFLEGACQALDLMVEHGAGVIDEVVANDLGMLGYLCDRVEQAQRTYEETGVETPFFGVGVVVGRLLNKDTRDPRDPEYPWIPYRPNLLQPSWEGDTFLGKLMLTWSYWNEASGDYRCPICGIEFDPTHEMLLLQDLPQGVTPALNGPLCYMSTGQICEYASIGLADGQLFRPNSRCMEQCAHTCITYQGTSGVEFTKLGRTVYFQPYWQTRLDGVESFRQLVSPLKEVRG